MSEELQRCPECGDLPTTFKAPIGWEALGCCCYRTKWCKEGIGEAADQWRYLIKGQQTGTDPKQALGATKAPLHLIPPAGNVEMAKALALGAQRYGTRNWLGTKVKLSTYLAAMLRHIDCIKDGEDIDPESGAHHMGHVMASAGIVLDALKHGTLVDDRVLPKPKEDK